MSRDGPYTQMIRDAVRAAARQFGIDIRRYSPRNDADLRRLRILETNCVDLVLDVGANVGQYGTKLRESGYSGRIVSFEPGCRAFAVLQDRAAADPGWRCERLVLGDHAGPARLSIANNLASSSLLDITELHLVAAPEARTVGTEEVLVRTLAEVLPNLIDETERPFLKVDVQGYELSVLRGAEDWMARILGAEIELSLTPLYRGQPLFREVLDFLEAADLALASLEPGLSDPRTGRLLQMDGLFVPRSSPWWREANRV